VTTINQRSIRTLHILTTLHRRGAETFAVQMIDHLDRDHFSPHIWPTRPARGDFALLPERTPVLSNRAAHPAGVIRELLRALRTVRPHLIQCHGGVALNYALATKLLWRPHAYVYNKIGSIHPYLDSSWKRRVSAVLFEQVDAIVAVGEEIRREIEGTFHPRRPRLVTISNGRDIRPFLAVTPDVTAQKRRELGLGSNDLCLMQVGITREKEPHTTLRAFAGLASAHPDLQLAFVGDGPMVDDLRQESVVRGLAHRVRTLGVRRDVPALLTAADLIVMPSSTEGLPGVLIEAGMAGRAAVAYDVGSVRSVLLDGVTGFVVPSGDARALLEKLALLIRNRALRERMGAEALQRCRRGFDIEASVRKYEALFTDLVSRSEAQRTRANVGDRGLWQGSR
jgi:glycosyltransferase involved in cell wall biosynthesis